MAQKRKDNLGRNLRQGESQRSNGSFEFKYSVGGKRRSITCKSLAELRDKEALIQKDIMDGIGIESETATVNMIFDRYISTKKSLSDRVRVHYLFSYARYIRGDFGERIASKIKYSDALRLYNDLMDEKNLAIGSVRDINVFLKPAFEMAVRDGIIRSNPFNGVIKELSKSHGAKTQKRKALTREQQKELMDFLRWHPIYKKYLPLFTVLLGTGLRIGECLSLTWSDIDFKGETISVNHSLVYSITKEGGHHEYHIVPPKTSAGNRTIPMLPEVKKSLLELRQCQMSDGFSEKPIDGYSNFVFITSGKQVYIAANINNLINSITKAHNEYETELAAKEQREPVLLPRFSCHTLRHTFATRLCEQESNMKIIQSIMGHEKISTTMEIYAEASQDVTKETFKNLDSKAMLG